MTAQEYAVFFAALCLRNIQTGPNKSLVLAAQNTMAHECAVDILSVVSEMEERNDLAHA